MPRRQLLTARQAWTLLGKAWAEATIEESEATWGVNTSDGICRSLHHLLSERISSQTFDEMEKELKEHLGWCVYLPVHFDDEPWSSETARGRRSLLCFMIAAAYPSLAPT
jgi:hypothetical protein